MSDHPYQSLPDRAFWKRSVANVPPASIDPLGETSFRISRADKVATAGSCFAQHISRRLRESGYTYLVTEPFHEISSRRDATEFGYEIFTARYGNVYTARQLVQLFERAYGRFQPQDDVWVSPEGLLIDPFRPQIQPDGFYSRREYDLDRKKHFRCVREAFETLDVFAFTLGLTEAWRSREDGAVYPICPGVAGGEFDERRHEFVNFDVEEVTADLLQFVDSLRSVNPRARVILTVSPVPLVATAAGEHVLSATVYSKSVLRVAAEQVTQAREDVLYFPSYEIVTGAFSRGAYFARDLREVTTAGVDHVMQVFFDRLTEGASIAAPSPRATAPRAESLGSEMERLAKLNCDEEALDRHRSASADRRYAPSAEPSARVRRRRPMD